MDDCIPLQLLFSINDNNIMPIKIIRDTPGYEVSIVKYRHRKYLQCQNLLLQIKSQIAPYHSSFV